MSDTIVLIFQNPNLALSDLELILKSIGKTYLSEKVLSITQNGKACHIVKVDDLEGDAIFEGWPESSIPKECTVFSVDYRIPEFVVSVVHLLAINESLLVNTDRGRVVDGRHLESRFLTE